MKLLAATAVLVHVALSTAEAATTSDILSTFPLESIVSGPSSAISRADPRRAIVAFASCATDKDCADTPNTVCDSADRVCVCDDGSGYVQDPSEPLAACVTKQEFCVTQCKVADSNAECVPGSSNLCRCKKPFAYNSSARRCTKATTTTTPPPSPTGSPGSSNKPCDDVVCQRVFGPNATCRKKTADDPNCGCKDPTMWIPTGTKNEPCRKFTVADCDAMCKRFYKGNVVCAVKDPTPDKAICGCADPKTQMMDTKAKACVDRSG